MRILIISQYYYPDIAGGSFRITETVDLLRKMGYQVRLVTSQPHRMQADKKDLDLQREQGVVRVPLVSFGNGGKWKYIAHYLSFMVTSMIAALFRGGQADVVLATSPPLFVGISGWVAARLKGAKFVLDIRDIWPDSAVATGHLSREGSLFLWAKALEEWLYNRADLITCVASPMAEYIQDFVPEKRIAIVYNGIQEKYLAPVPVSEKVEGLVSLSSGKINVVYVGNMGFCQALGVVVEAAKYFQEQGDERLKFFLVGNGAERDALAAEKERIGLKNLHVVGPVPKSEAVRLVYDASALVLQLKEDPAMEKTIPSKVFEYMAGGNPILFGIEGEGKSLLESVPGNLGFQPNNVESLQACLTQLRDNYDTMAEAAKENKQKVREYTREKMVDRLASEMVALVGEE